MMSSEHICVTEHQYIINRKNILTNTDKVISLCHKDFSELEELIISNSKEDNYEDIFEIAYNKIYKKVIRTKNYVGIIQLSSGSTIEILPKLYGMENEESCRRILLNMLKVVWNISYKLGGMANLSWGKMNLYDIFIMFFLKELNILLSRGLKSSYIETEDNLKVYKGKLMVNEHIKNNIVHKARFYVKYDEYNRDRVENRIIKSTLAYLYKKTRSNFIKVDIRKIMNELDDINESYQIDTDLKKCTVTRDMKEYKSILNWCNMFLKGNTFINKQGQDKTKSILFNMNKLFRKYIELKIMRSDEFEHYNILEQYTPEYLIEYPQKEYKLLPQIYIEKENNSFIINAEWKIIHPKDLSFINLFNNDNLNFKDINKETLYKLYIYCKKYNARKAILIYPCLNMNIEPRHYNFESNVEFIIVFVNLQDVKKSISIINDLL